MSVPARQLIQRAVKASATAWSGAVLGRLAPSAGLLRHLSVFQAFSGTAEQSSAAFSPAEPAYKGGSRSGPGPHGASDMEAPYIPGLMGRRDAEFMELLRTTNQTLPLRGQVIIGHVVHVEKKSILVDTGFKTHQRFMKKELPMQCLVARADGHEPDLLTGDIEFRVGDQLHLIVRNPSTPYGDMQLEVQSYKTEAKQLAVVSELRAAMQAGRPVPGRVLNAVNGGYSVGVAGIVGFLPSSRASVNTVKKIGVLQPFLILTLEELTTHVNLVLTDPYPRPRTRRIIRGRLL